MTIPGVAAPAPAVPPSAWALAWTSLASQLAYVVRSGLRDDDAVSLVVSVLLGALLVGWVSAGVLRARMVRLVLVWVVLVLALVFELLGLWGVGGPGELLVALGLLALGVAQVGALWRFCRTDWFAWHRADPPKDARPAITALLAVAVVVGVLGGLVDRAEQTASFDISVGAVDR